MGRPVPAYGTLREVARPPVEPDAPHTRRVIRQLTPADVAVLRSLRLAALTDAPDAYGSSYEVEARWPESAWIALLESQQRATFAWSDGTARGMVVALRDDDPTIIHLVHLWVEPGMRGGSIAADLVAHVLQWAADEGAHTVRLAVTEGNARAERLYLRHGFTRTGDTFPRSRDGAAMVRMSRPIADR